MSGLYCRRNSSQTSCEREERSPSKIEPAANSPMDIKPYPASGVEPSPTFLVIRGDCRLPSSAREISLLKLQDCYGQEGPIAIRGTRGPGGHLRCGSFESKTLNTGLVNRGKASTCVHRTAGGQPIQVVGHLEVIHKRASRKSNLTSSKPTSGPLGFSWFNFRFSRHLGSIATVTRSRCTT